MIRRIAGFGLVTVVFAVSDPLLLIGFPLATLLLAYGPRDGRVAVLLLAIFVLGALGDRSGLWWFDRGWPLLLAGSYLWVGMLGPRWSFSARTLAAIGLAALFGAGLFAMRPTAWLDLDASISAASAHAARQAVTLLGEGAGESLGQLVGRVAHVQAAVFPALVGLSSLGALGTAVSVREWLTDESEGCFGSLASFRFNDHLIWVWVAGLILVLAPLGAVAERVGGNAVLFMGLLYVVRGMAVAVALTGGVSLMTGVLGGLVAVILYPVAVLVLALALALGVGDTWLDVRNRFGSRSGDD